VVVRQWAAAFHPHRFPAGDVAGHVAVDLQVFLNLCALSSQCLPEPEQLLLALSSLMNWIPWPLVVDGVEIQGASWTGERASCILGRAAYLRRLGGWMHRIALRGRGHPNSFSFAAPFSSSAWPVSSLWTSVLLFALPQIAQACCANIWLRQSLVQLLLWLLAAPFGLSKVIFHTPAVLSSY